MHDLSGKLREWTAAGLLSPDQAAAILTHEDAEPPAGGGISRVAEALGYLGAAFVVSAGAVLLGEFWADLTVAAQSVLVGVIALALLAAGAGLRGGQDPAVGRLVGVLWFGSVAGMVLLTHLLVEEAVDVQGEGALLAVSAVGAAYGGILWWYRPGALQGLATFLAVVLGLYALFEMVASGRARGVADLFGLALWGLGLAWGLLGWGGLLRPERGTLAVGALATLVGAQILVFQAGEGLPVIGEPSALGLLLGLATAVGLIAASVATARTVLLGLGTGGMVVFVPQGVHHFFGETLGVPVALLVAGLVVLAAAVLAVRLRREVIAPGAAQSRERG